MTADGTDGGEVSLGDCETASSWEVLGNGQLKLNASGDLCFTQKGLAPGRANVAAFAASSATSTSNAAHGAYDGWLLRVGWSSAVDRRQNGRGRQHRNILGVAVRRHERSS